MDSERSFCSLNTFLKLRSQLGSRERNFSRYVIILGLNLNIHQIHVYWLFSMVQRVRTIGLPFSSKNICSTMIKYKYVNNNVLQGVFYLSRTSFLEGTVNVEGKDPILVQVNNSFINLPFLILLNID